MEKIVIELDVQSDKGVKDVDKLNKSLSKTNENQKNIKKSTDETRKATKKATSSSQRNAAAFEAVNKATGGAIRGFRALIKQMLLLVANPIGAVIAALVLGITALYKAFTSTKAGGEQLDRVMAGISATMDVVRDRVLKVGDAIVKFFTGDFKGALKSAKESVSGFGEEVAKEFNQAAQSVKSLQEVKDSLRDLSVSRAKLNRDLVQAKEIIEGSTASYSEKRKAIDEVRIAETKQTEDELKNAKKKLDAIVLANSLSDSGTEDLEKEAQARIEVINLETISSANKTKFNKLSKLADNEELSRLKALADEKKRIIDEDTANEAKAAADKKAIDDKLIADKKAIRELEANTEAEKRALALEKEKEKFDNAIALATEQGLSTEELERSQKESLQLMRDEFAQTDIDREKKVINEVEAANILKAQKEAEIEEARVNTKKKALDDIISLAGSESKIGKAALIAKQLILAQEMIISIKGTIAAAKASAIKAQLKAAESGVDIAAGGAKAVSSFAPPFNIPIILGYAVQAAGIISSIKGAMSASKSATSKVGVSGGGSAAISTPKPAAPSFNIVGASETSQLADSIGGQSKEPIKAFVVANDVSSAQEMDRNIIEGASL